MNFPGSVKVKEINSRHKDLECNKIEMYSALYSGGSDMTKDIKKQIIFKRANEIQFQPEIYEQRVQRAYYINRAGGLIDSIVSMSTADTPRITVSENATEEQKEFWMNLNLNANGEGKPLATVFRTAMKDMLVSKIPYVNVVIDEDDINIDNIKPAIVIDWDIECEDPWIKTYAVNNVKESPFSSEALIENIWTIYTNTDTVVYKSISKDNGKNYLWRNGDVFGSEETAVAIRSDDDSVYGHDFGVFPIFLAKSTDDQWVMDRISENIKALYNAESDLAWVLSQSAYPQGILKLESEKRAQSIYNKSESAIWNLLANESYEIVSSNGTDFNAQFKNVDRLKLSLQESMQMLAKEASAIPQAGRLSGEAVREMRSPLDALLQSFLWPIIDQFYDIIDAIKLYRNEEDLGVYIEGCNIPEDQLELRKLLFGDVVEEEKEEMEEEEMNDGERQTEESNGGEINGGETNGGISPNGGREEGDQGE